MKLNLSQIKTITLGATRVERDDNGISFYRFTRQQEALYKERNTEYYVKTFGTSGVKLSFRTDSRTLFLSADVTASSSRSYFAIDLVVNGKRVDALKNFVQAELPLNYTVYPLPFGEVSKHFDLGDGEKDICIHLPWSAKITLKELSLDDGSFVTPIRPDKKLICFGDSITHGYDALYPSDKYTSRLADALGAEEYNKGIGAETFCPDIAGARDDFDPDYITVAYGTNDWNRCTKEEFGQKCTEFYANLSANYPNAKIFAITPIWRRDMNESRPFGAFEEAAELIKSIASQHGNIHIIEGIDLVPHDEKLYADQYLHPNDSGFEYYFNNLSNQIAAILQHNG